MVLDFHHASRLDGARHGVGVLALRPHHAHVRRLGQQERADAAQQTAAADADEHRLQAGQLVQHLRRHRPLAGEERHTEAGMHEQRARFCGERAGPHHGVVVVARLVEHARAAVGDALLLDGRRVGRNKDRRRDSELPGRLGHAEPVIAGARGDDAPRALLRGELRQRIERAAQLERPRELLGLELQVDVAAGEGREGGRAAQRGADGDATDDIGGGADFGGGGEKTGHAGEDGGGTPSGQRKPWALRSMLYAVRTAYGVERTAHGCSSPEAHRCS